MRCNAAEQINLTPWARREYENALEEIENETPVEMARRLFFRLWMSFSGQYNTCKSSWRRASNGKRVMRLDIREENLFAASRRLINVQIENRDAFRLIRELDSPETLFYLDPPYVFSTRTTSKAYSHEI